VTFRFASLVAVTGALGVAGFLVVPVTADNGSPQTGHIGICHHTGKSPAHEWVYIEPDASGVFAGHANVNHQNIEFGQEDIIPAFVFVDAHGASHSYPGLNLATRYDSSLEPTAGGQFTGAQILAAHCVAPTPTAPVHATTTTPAAPVHVTTTTPASPGSTVTVTTPAAISTVTVTVTTPTPPAPPPVTVTVTTTTAGTAGKTVTVTKTVVKTPQKNGVKGTSNQSSQHGVKGARFQKPRLAHTT
jgi:hypothetical protein